MRNKSFLLSAFASVFVCCAMISGCSSDHNPAINIDVNGADAYIKLDLSVAATRATDDDEEALKVVDIYIFDADESLEQTETLRATDEGGLSKPIETTSGYKTIYAVAGMDDDLRFDSEPTQGMSITDFEAMLFDSRAEALENDNGLLMLGKSNPTQIIKSTSSSIPSTNVMHIILVRVMAKASVAIKDEAEEINAIGMKFSEPNFCIMQNSLKTRVVSDIAAGVEHSKTEGKATYSNFSELTAPDSETNAYRSTSRYMAENITATHVSGNTTFLSISFRAIPTVTYTFSESGNLNSSNVSDASAISDYYAVGMEIPAQGTVDYACTGKVPYCFQTEADADRYAAKLNSDQGLTDATASYKSILISDCRVYYRVNIVTPADMADTYGSHSVVRNKHYKISIGTVNKLGSNREDLLFPTDADAPLELTSAFLSTTFEVAPWDDIDQPVDLE